MEHINEDNQKQSVEIISQQQTLETDKENQDFTLTENSIANSSSDLQIRKKRGIFTTTASNSALLYSTVQQSQQHNYCSKFEGGDNAHIQNLHPVITQEIETVQHTDRTNECINLEVSNQRSQSPPLATQSVSAQPDFTITNDNSVNGYDEAAIIESVDNLVGNYQVNPSDGCLVRILTVQSHDSVQNDSEVETKLTRDIVGTEWKDMSNDIDVDYSQITGSQGKRKYRKRKYREANQEEYFTNTKHRRAGGIPKPTGDKAEEVLKAAKSLFSKRTRTLYHWLYPSTSKLELKNIVISAWDTLQESEKHFYISQVLGRFGFPASNLMVNPQIGGLQGMPTDHLRGSIASASGIFNHFNGINDDTKRAVEELLTNEQEHEWNTLSKSNRICDDKRKRQKSLNFNPLLSLVNDESNHRSDTLSCTGDDDSNSTNFDDEEFQNDPELNKEFFTFKMNRGIDLNTDNNLQA